MTTDHKNLRAKAEAATPGEWLRGDQTMAGEIYIHVRQTIIARVHRLYRDKNNAEQKANAAFIAAANPQTVLALLDEVEALREALDQIRKSGFVTYVGDKPHVIAARALFPAKSEGVE